LKGTKGETDVSNLGSRPVVSGEFFFFYTRRYHWHWRGKKVTIFSNDLGSAAYFVFRLRTGPRPKLAISNNTPKSDRIFNCKNVFAL